MTVANDENKITYVGNGTTKDFSVPFYFINEADIKVSVNDGISTTDLIINQDYTLTGAGEQNGGSITVNTAIPTGVKLLILREVPFLQNLDIPENDRFSSQNMERALDRLTMQTQQLKEQVDRAVTVDIFSETDPSSLVSEIETIYNIRDEVVTVAENSERITACSAVIPAIIDAPNQANSARNSAIEATNSAVTAQLMSDLASESATAASASAGAAEQSAVQASVNAKNGHVVGEIVSVFGTSSYVPFGCVLADGTEYTKALFPSVWSDYIKGESVGNAYCWVFNDNTNLYTLKSNPSVGDYLYFYTNGILTTRCIVTSVVDANTLTMRNIGINDILTVVRNSAGDLSNVSIPLLPTTDYSQYQNEITACGQCAMFAVDSANETFKVPTIKDGGYLTQALSVGEIGRAYNESLPNITGDSNIAGLAGKTSLPTGALTQNRYQLDTRFQTMPCSTDDLAVIGLDASLSSSTYQNGAKVQGDNVRVRFFVCLAGGVINESMIDWQNYITALSGKANTDLSNVTAAGKSAAVGWCIPDYAAGVDISGYTTSDNQFTCPKHGIVVFNVGGTGNVTSGGYINNILVYVANVSAAHWDSVPFLVSKGDKVYSYTQANYGTGKFYPMKGAQ